MLQLCISPFFSPFLFPFSFIFLVHLYLFFPPKYQNKSTFCTMIWYHITSTFFCTRLFLGSMAWYVFLVHLVNWQKKITLPIFVRFRMAVVASFFFLLVSFGVFFYKKNVHKNERTILTTINMTTTIFTFFSYKYCIVY